jgi:hypothetical protein
VNYSIIPDTNIVKWGFENKGRLKTYPRNAHSGRDKRKIETFRDK